MRERFLAAILADPFDDGPRLILADFLDEQGDPLGEFIRVQIELASLDESAPACNRYADQMGCDCRECLRYYWASEQGRNLRRRERELWMSRGWWNLPKELHSLFSVHIDQTLPHGGGDPGTSNPFVVVRRGFPDSVSLPLSAFMRQCERCGVEAHGETCPTCRGTGWQGAGGALFLAAPLTAVRLVDCEPQSIGQGRVVWLCENDYEAPSPNHLPGVLFDRLPAICEYIDSDMQIAYKTFDTAEVANGWLPRACVAWGRQLAGLPPLEEARRGPDRP